METMVLMAQAISLSLAAAWLTIGAAENVFKPVLNETYTSEVLDMTRMREDYPEAYALVAHRRVVNPRTRRLLFRFIVVWECLSAIAMWIGAGALGLATLGHGDPETARVLGLLGALMFTSIWAGFLVAGNWWCYWFGHEGGQNTHFHMTGWGMTNMIFLVVAPG